MEKSFLNFKAAHPDWTPNDPSGSLYLSRMADLSAAHPAGLTRRRLFHRMHMSTLSGDMENTVHLHAPGTTTGLADRAREYDRALRASQNVRKRGAAASVMMGSVLHPAQLRPADSMLQSGVVNGAAIAQTAILGDSQGSIMPGAGIVESVIPEEDLAADGGVGSALGESYVDGRRPRANMGLSQQEEEDEELEDGGVLGLLAQIYGAGANLKGRGRGPPRAI